MGKKQWNR